MPRMTIDPEDLVLFSTIANRRPISSKHSLAARKNMAQANQGSRRSPKWLRQLKRKRNGNPPRL